MSNAQLVDWYIWIFGICIPLAWSGFLLVVLIHLMVTGEVPLW